MAERDDGGAAGWAVIAIWAMVAAALLLASCAAPKGYRDDLTPDLDGSEWIGG